MNSEKLLSLPYSEINFETPLAEERTAAAAIPLHIKFSLSKNSRLPKATHLQRGNLKLWLM